MASVSVEKNVPISKNCEASTFDLFCLKKNNEEDKYPGSVPGFTELPCSLCLNWTSMNSLKKKPSLLSYLWLNPCS